MMRKLLFLLPALVLAAFSADAQTPQRGLAEAVAQNEPGTLIFEFSVQPDGKTVDLLELYQNADAFVAHVKNMRATFKPEENPRKPGKITVFGSPNAEMKEILARRDPVYETYIDGFMR